jgi:hypothetical protein
MVLVSALACASSGSTSLTSSWRAPTADRLQFRRLLTSLVSTDPIMRRAIEDRLAARIPDSFAAYSAVPELALGNPEVTREQLRRKLFDGAVVVRVLGLRGENTSLPGSGGYTTYPGFYGYWESSWTTLRNPAYVAPDTQVTVEIVVYSLADDKLVWAGRTTTTKLASVQEALDQSVDAVVRELWSTRSSR